MSKINTFDKMIRFLFMLLLPCISEVSFELLHLLLPIHPGWLISYLRQNLSFRFFMPKQFIQLIQLTNFTSQMISYFVKMKQFYLQEEIKRKRIFQEQKQQISKLVLQKKLEKQKIQQKLNKKEAKKLKSQRKKKQKEIKEKLKAPKAPNTPYFMFFMDYKQKIKEDFPQYSVVQAAKMAGKLWKELQDDQKQAYYIRHQQQKKQYQEALKEYKQKRRKYDVQEEQNKKWNRILMQKPKFIQTEKEQKLLNKSEKLNKYQQKFNLLDRENCNQSQGIIQELSPFKLNNQNLLQKQQEKLQNDRKQILLEISFSSSQSSESIIGEPASAEQKKQLLKQQQIYKEQQKEHQQKQFKKYDSMEEILSKLRKENQQFSKLFQNIKQQQISKNNQKLKKISPQKIEPLQKLPQTIQKSNDQDSFSI